MIFALTVPKVGRLYRFLPCVEHMSPNFFLLFVSHRICLKFSVRGPHHLTYDSVWETVLCRAVISLSFLFLTWSSLSTVPLSWKKSNSLSYLSPTFFLYKHLLKISFQFSAIFSFCYEITLALS